MTSPENLGQQFNNRSFALMMGADALHKMDHASNFLHFHANGDRSNVLSREEVHHSARGVSHFLDKAINLHNNLNEMSSSDEVNHVIKHMDASGLVAKELLFDKSSPTSRTYASFASGHGRDFMDGLMNYRDAMRHFYTHGDEWNPHNHD